MVCECAVYMVYIQYASLEIQVNGPIGISVRSLIFEKYGYTWKLGF